MFVFSAHYLSVDVSNLLDFHFLCVTLGSLPTMLDLKTFFRNIYFSQNVYELIPQNPFAVHIWCSQTF